MKKLLSCLATSFGVSFLAGLFTVVSMGWEMGLQVFLVSLFVIFSLAVIVSKE
jgi:hypothetical protein